MYAITTEPNEVTAPSGIALDTGSHSMKTLVAEDNPIFQTSLCFLLNKWGYQPIVARDGDEAWRILQAADAPRLAILDWMMPGINGVDLCRRIRSTGGEPYVYVLLLTARADSQDLVEGMDAGADDYVTKPYKSHELRVRLRAGRRIVDLQAELLRAREALREQATHDALTGLLNRGSILEELRNELARAGRDRQPLSLLMADIDRFKDVNDTYGHLAGDAVLREAALRMKASVRRYDAVGRYGGEEFLMVLPGCQGAAALAQAERIRSAFAAEPFAIGSQSIRATCSIGVSGRMAASLADADILIREADVALYQAKNQGRNLVAEALQSALNLA